MDWAALVISIVSVAIAGFALFWNIRYNREEPGWRSVIIDVRGPTTAEPPVMYLSFRNIGDGAGHDVRIAKVEGATIHRKDTHAFRTTRVESGHDTPAIRLKTKNWVDFDDIYVTLEWTRRPTYLGKTARQRLAIGPEFSDMMGLPKAAPDGKLQR